MNKKITKQDLIFVLVLMVVGVGGRMLFPTPGVLHDWVVSIVVAGIAVGYVHYLRK